MIEAQQFLWWSGIFITRNQVELEYTMKANKIDKWNGNNYEEIQVMKYKIRSDANHKNVT